MSSFDDFVKGVEDAMGVLESKGSADGIADFLRAEGAKGDHIFYDCPVVNWLKTQVDHTEYKVYLSHSWYLVVPADDARRVIHSDGQDYLIQVFVPSVVESFLVSFDHGEYPALEESA